MSLKNIKDLKVYCLLRMMKSMMVHPYQQVLTLKFNTPAIIIYSVDTHSCVQALKVALQHSLALTDAKEASYKSLKAETEVGKYLKQTVSHKLYLLHYFRG